MKPGEACGLSSIFDWTMMQQRLDIFFQVFLGCGAMWSYQWLALLWEYAVQLWSQHTHALYSVHIFIPLDK